jgi:hypothetical protein
MTVRCRLLVSVVVLLTCDAVSARDPQPGELIERTMAIVGGQVLTLSDVRTAVSLGLVSGVETSADVAEATPRLVDRMLMLREVQRYAPPEPPHSDVDHRLAAVRDRFATPDLYARALQSGGFTEARLRAWIRDDLRVASYLNQRFAAAAPTEVEVSDPARERAAIDRRAALIADWIEDLRRRTTIVELWKTPKQDY